MNSGDFSRRTFLTTLAGAAVATPALLDIRAADELPQSSGKRLKIVCVGGHPDDPESSSAGTLARYAAAGHAVTIIYLTRGERGINGKSLDEAAAIRTRECEEACRIIGAKAVFAGQIDGATELNRGRVQQMRELLGAEKPDLIFTHWPIDTHLDHQIASLLVLQSTLQIAPRPEIYFFEVDTGSQTQGFSPNTYVDVSTVLEKKKAALLAHESQNGEAIWRQHHEPVAIFRGREAGVSAAEAFVRLTRLPGKRPLPGA